MKYLLIHVKCELHELSGKVVFRGLKFFSELCIYETMHLRSHIGSSKGSAGTGRVGPVGLGAMNTALEHLLNHLEVNKDSPSISLAYASIGDDGCVEIARFLRDNIFVKTLDLRGNNVQVLHQDHFDENIFQCGHSFYSWTNVNVYRRSCVQIAYVVIVGLGSGVFCVVFIFRIVFQ